MRGSDSSDRAACSIEADTLARVSWRLRSSASTGRTTPSVAAASDWSIAEEIAFRVRDFRESRAVAARDRREAAGREIHDRVRRRFRHPLHLRDEPTEVHDVLEGAAEGVLELTGQGAGRAFERPDAAAWDSIQPAGSERAAAALSHWSPAAPAASDAPSAKLFAAS